MANIPPLELCTDEDLEFVEREKTKLLKELNRIAPNIQLCVEIRPAVAIEIVERMIGGYQYRIPNEHPQNSDSRCLLITRQKATYLNSNVEAPAAGYAGVPQGWIQKNRLEQCGDLSYHIILHEWLHTISDLTGINPDNAASEGYEGRGNHDVLVWVKNGLEWNRHILSQFD